MSEIILCMVILLISLVICPSAHKQGEILGCVNGIKSYYDMDLTESELVSINKFCEELK